MRKKILFWINSGSMNIFGLSKYLQPDTDAEFFAIYDVTDKPKKFFQDQKIVNFKKIWFYHDFINKKTSQPDLNYLKKFEKDTNISLWKLASTERIFLYNEFYKFSTEEITSILEQECKFFEFFFKFRYITSTLTRCPKFTRKCLLNCFFFFNSDMRIK